MVRAARWQDVQGYQRGLVVSLLAVTILSNGIKEARVDERGKKYDWGGGGNTERRQQGEKSGGKKQVGLKTRWPRRGKEVNTETYQPCRKGRQTFTEVGNQFGLFFAGPFF